MKTLLTLAAMSLLALTSCSGHRAAAARAPDGSAFTLEVYFDRNNQLRNPDQVNEVVGYMEPDLHRILQRNGYTVVPTNNPEAFVPGPNKFLLVVKITNYNAGSKAARMLVGYGAGSLVLDTQHLLFAGPGQLIFQSAGSVGSARDWNYAARKINEQVNNEVSRALSTRR